MRCKPTYEVFLLLTIILIRTTLTKSQANRLYGRLYPLFVSKLIISKIRIERII